MSIIRIYETAEYKRIIVNRKGEVSLGNMYYESNVIGSFGKAAVINTSPYDSGKSYSVLMSRTYLFSKVPSPLFISPKSKIPRDLLRNNNYKIVRDADKAAAVVVPKPNKEFDRVLTNAVVFDKSNNHLYLYDISYSYYGQVIDDNTKKEVIELLKTNYLNADIICNSDLSNVSVDFIPKVQEWYDILEDRYPSRTYILDTEIPLSCGTDITLENLELWKSMVKDNSLFGKTVAQSKWKQFPLTVFTFLKQSWNQWPSSADPALKYVLDSLGYDKYGGFEPFTMLDISVEDWNLCQQYLAKELTGKAEGGFIARNMFDKLLPDVKDFVLSKLCVKPYLIKDQAPYQKLKTEVRNLNK